MKIAFHSFQLGDRGTEVCLYKYAKYNREILGNESVIISTSTRPIPTYGRFASEFEVFLYPHVWSNKGVQGCNDGLQKHLESLVLFFLVPIRPLTNCYQAKFPIPT